MAWATCFAVLALGLWHPAEARAERERSVAVAYALSGGLFFVPLQLGTHLIDGADNDSGWTRRDTVIASSLYVSLAWGASAGYFYGGNTRYALVGALGRSALLSGGVAAAATLESDGHPYLSASALIFTMGWSIVDLALLWRSVDRQNKRRRAARAPAEPTARLRVLPVVSSADQGLTLGLSGRF